MDETQTTINTEEKILVETTPVVVEFSQEDVDSKIEQLSRNLENSQKTTFDIQGELDVWQGRKQKMIDGGIYE